MTLKHLNIRTAEHALLLLCLNVFSEFYNFVRFKLGFLLQEKFVDAGSNDSHLRIKLTILPKFIFVCSKAYLFSRRFFALFAEFHLLV